jgi:hypothetical protein
MHSMNGDSAVIVEDVQAVGENGESSREKSRLGEPKRHLDSDLCHQCESRHPGATAADFAKRWVKQHGFQARSVVGGSS